MSRRLLLPAHGAQGVTRVFHAGQLLRRNETAAVTARAGLVVQAGDVLLGHTLLVTLRGRALLVMSAVTGGVHVFLLSRAE